ncbi:MAG: hypothetical protein SFY68_05490 [Candidatus Sumerlaeia bacterium]|nr:hypothetical protein [Candidatus Sumerlaeia bacterium]
MIVPDVLSKYDRITLKTWRVDTAQRAESSQPPTQRQQVGGKVSDLECNPEWGATMCAFDVIGFVQPTTGLCLILGDVPTDSLRSSGAEKRAPAGRKVEELRLF